MERLTVKYELRERREGSANRESFGSHDAVYLIMPEFLEGTQFATWMAKSFFLSKFFGIG